MGLDNDSNALVTRMEELLADLDRLKLSMVAVHVDLALVRLKEIIALGEFDANAD
jgi:hypothetical protein